MSQVIWEAETIHTSSCTKRQLKKNTIYLRDFQTFMKVEILTQVIYLVSLLVVFHFLKLNFFFNWNLIFRSNLDKSTQVDFVNQLLKIQKNIFYQN